MSPAFTDLDRYIIIRKFLNYIFKIFVYSYAGGNVTHTNIRLLFRDVATYDVYSFVKLMDFINFLVLSFVQDCKSQHKFSGDIFVPVFR
jgi:hypothetical protein